MDVNFAFQVYTDRPFSRTHALRKTRVLLNISKSSEGKLLKLALSLSFDGNLWNFRKPPNDFKANHAVHAENSSSVLFEIRQLLIAIFSLRVCVYSFNGWKAVDGAYVCGTCF